MDFNFNSDYSYSNDAPQYLRPYDIYPVVLSKIEKTELKGSKDPNAVYPVVALEFTGVGESKGVFTTNLFIPSTEDDKKRPEFTNAEGHTYNRPSRLENFQFTLMQIVHAINPEGEKKIKANGPKIKTIDQFVDLIVKALTGKEKVETNLKLVGRNNNGTVYATLPSACGLNKEGKLFPLNFIGENLFFTNYELTQQKNYQNAKPTTMSPDTTDENTDNFDLDDIEV